MDRNEYIEYTPEGFKKVYESLDFLPEEMRKMMLTNVINSILA